MPLPHDEAAWQMIDAFARVFTGRPVQQSQPLHRFEIWSREFKNIPAKFSPYPAVVPGYQAQFKKLWGK